MVRSIIKLINDPHSDISYSLLHVDAMRKVFTHWGHVTHVCVGKATNWAFLKIIGSRLSGNIYYLNQW